MSDIVDEDRLRLAIDKGFIIGDRERMCRALIERVKVLEFDLTVVRRGYETLDHLYSACQAERISLRSRISDLEESIQNPGD